MKPGFIFLKHAVQGLVNLVVPGSGMVVDFAADWAEHLHERWAKKRQAKELREDLVEVIELNETELRAEIHEQIEVEAANLSPEEKAQVEVLIQQLPASIRRTMRRPADPKGTTIPAHLIPRSRDDILRILPDRPPRFQPGDRP
ncbi:MAG: hypothetical protein ACI8UO_004230, partial [Verrucomicrobiales bacterium]